MANVDKSAANIALVKALYADFARADIAAILAAADPAIAWESVGRSEDFPVAGAYKGIAGIQEFFRRVAENCDFSEFSPNEFGAIGDKVVALGHYTLTVRKTGRQVSCPWVHVFRIRDGKVTEYREHTDTAQFARAYRS